MVKPCTLRLYMAFTAVLVISGCEQGAGQVRSASLAPAAAGTPFPTGHAAAEGGKLHSELFPTAPIRSTTAEEPLPESLRDSGAVKPAGPPPPPVTYTAEIAAVGDILLHNTVYQDAADGKGGYDFRPMFAQAAEELRKPDLLIANQESVMGGSSLGLSSYPVFNSPFEIAGALQDAGVDLVTMANNHIMDRGERGIQAAIGELNRIGLPYAGAYSSPEDRSAIRVLEAEGIRFAFLAYTYGTNGIPVPKDKPYLVGLLEEDRIREEIAEAKKQSDFTVVSVHWGIENEATPSSDQKAWARKLADWGADIIVGTHPHVLQPMEWLPRPDGGRTLVMYSLGNFLSAQDRLPQLIGGIAQVSAVKEFTSDGTVIRRLEQPALIPTYNRYKNWRTYRVIPFDRLEQEDWKTVSPVWEGIRSRLLEAMPELSVRQ